MANKDTQRTSAESYRDDRKARLAQSAKKSQKKSEKSKAAAKIVKMVVAIVLAVVVAGGIVWKVLDDTAVIKKNTTVFSVGDDIRVSEVEFTYYYSQYLNNIYSYAQQYAMYGMNIGIDPTKSPDEQNYGTDADGNDVLLSDYIKDETISALQSYKILYAEALKAGYKLTDDEQKSIDDQIEELRNTAAESNYSLNAYLKASYGKGVNEKFMRKQLEMQNIVTRYQSDTSTNLTNSYSDADINTNSGMNPKYFLARRDTVVTGTNSNGKPVTTTAKAYCTNYVYKRKSDGKTAIMRLVFDLTKSSGIREDKNNHVYLHFYTKYIAGDKATIDLLDVKDQNKVNLYAKDRWGSLPSLSCTPTTPETSSMTCVRASLPSASGWAVAQPRGCMWCRTHSPICSCPSSSSVDFCPLWP